MNTATRNLEPNNYSNVLPAATPEKFAEYCFIKSLSLSDAKDLWAKNSSKWAEAEQYAMGPPNFECGIAAEKTIRDRFEFLCRLGRGLKPAPTQPEQAIFKTDPIEEWDATVAQIMATGIPKHKAVNKLAKSNPGLHRRYLDQFNAKARTKQK